MTKTGISPEWTGRTHGGMIVKRLTALLIVALALLSVPGRTQNPQPGAMPALSLVQPGQWFLKSRANPAKNRSVCVGDVRALLQVEHGDAMCNRFVIANAPRETTVHYTCPGSGHGRTTIKVETPRLIQIESQGIARQEPFAVEFEGRRVGECKVATRSALH